jgi:membrane fusion protein (multidrug efflux system)
MTKPITPNSQSPKPFKVPAFIKNPVVITLLVVLGIFVIYGLQILVAQLTRRMPPPASVSTTVVHQESWPKTLTLVTRLYSPEGALLKAQMAGVLKEIHFTPGQMVKKGDLLLAVDSDYERAAAKLAKLDYERARQLRDQNVNTQNDLDNAEAAYAEAQATLDKKDIRAPFDGKVGITQVYLGQYINVGDPLVAIESLKQINADFGVPQVSLPLVKAGSPVELTVDAYPDAIFKGRVEGISPRLDDATLNAAARAVFENGDGRLLSGMYGSLKVSLSENQTGCPIPEVAVSYSVYGDYVYVLSSNKDPKTGKVNKVVTQTFVTLGDTQGDFVLVTKGLKAGDEIVTAGALKLHNGSAVSIDNSNTVPLSRNPHPQES